MCGVYAMGLTSFRVWCAVCYGVLCVFNCVKKIEKKSFCVPSTPLVRHTQAGSRVQAPWHCVQGELHS